MPENVIHILVSTLAAIAVLAVKAMADALKKRRNGHDTPERLDADLRTLVREGFKNVNSRLDALDKDSMMMHQRYHDLSNNVAGMQARVELMLQGRIRDAGA